MTLIAGEPYFIRRDQPSAMIAAAAQALGNTSAVDVASC